MTQKKNYINKLFIKLYSFLQKYSLSKVKEIMYFVDRIISLFIKTDCRKNVKKQICIIYNLALGDGIVFQNSIKNLPKIYPKSEYEITFFCQKGLKKIYEASNIFTEIIELDFNKATINLIERYKNIKLLKKKQYDLLLDPIGANECFTNVLMSRCVKAKKKVGCINSFQKVTCSKYILKRTYNEIKYLTEKSLIGQYFEFFYDKYLIEYTKTKSIKPKIALPKEYYIVFPSASSNLKKWPLERYAEIIKKIYAKTKIPLLVCGTSADIEDVSRLIEMIKDIPIVNIINKTTLLEFIYVIQKAKFIITNDTSTYHIAVINQIPVTIIVGGYTYDRYVSYKFLGCEKYKQPYIVCKNSNCLNCYNKCCKLQKEDHIWPCLNDIKVSDAWQVIEKMINLEIEEKNEIK